MKSPLNNQEIRDILSSNDNQTMEGKRNAILVLFILSTGLKPQELCQVRVCDVVRDGRPLHRLRIDAFVSHNGRRREVALDNLAQGCVEKLLLSYSNHKIVIKPSHRLFHDLKSAADVKRALGTLGLRCCPMRLRRSFAKRLYGKGLDYFEIADQMGLKTIGSAMRHADGRESEAVELLIQACDPGCWSFEKACRFFHYHFPYWSQGRCWRIVGDGFRRRGGNPSFDNGRW